MTFNQGDLDLLQSGQPPLHGGAVRFNLRTSLPSWYPTSRDLTLGQHEVINAYSSNILDYQGLITEAQRQIQNVAHVSFTRVSDSDNTADLNYLSSTDRSSDFGGLPMVFFR